MSHTNKECFPRHVFREIKIIAQYKRVSPVVLQKLHTHTHTHTHTQPYVYKCIENGLDFPSIRCSERPSTAIQLDSGDVYPYTLHRPPPEIQCGLGGSRRHPEGAWLLGRLP